LFLSVFCFVLLTVAIFFNLCNDAVCSKFYLASNETMKNWVKPGSASFYAVHQLIFTSEAFSWSLPPRLFAVTGWLASVASVFCSVLAVLNRNRTQEEE
jgi:hypothetical protein